MSVDRAGAFRLNVFAGREAYVTWTGHEPREPGGSEEAPTADDAVFAHPVYGSLGWLAVVNPGPRTVGAVETLLRTAHALARTRYQRRSEATA